MSGLERSLTVAALVAALGFAAAACAQTPQTTANHHTQDGSLMLIVQPPTQIGLTVYSSADPAGFDPQKFIAQQRNGYNPNFVWQVPGFGVVREVRPVRFQKGEQTLDFTDVAQFIDPTTVSFTDLNNPNATQILDQQFQFDLVSPRKLLEKYVDHQVTIFVDHDGGKTEQVTGKLLSARQGLVLQTPQGLRLINGYSSVRLSKLPQGLLTRPTLVLHVNSAAAGNRPVQVAYQTAGITWRADYNLVLNHDSTRADLGAWVTLLNLSGKSYPHATLKLIAGEVNRVKPRQPRPLMMRQRMAMNAAAPEGFKEQTFFEYHLYTLPRPVTVHDNSTQQITLFPTAHRVSVDKVLAYYGLPEASNWFFASPRTDRNLGNQSNHEVDVYVRFKNSQNNHLGMPLPAGKVRVYQHDPDGTLEFLGEDLIKNTPKDETLLIKVGKSFDIVGDRTQTSFHVDNKNDTMTESIKIELRNHKDKDAHVIVKENLYRWTNWTITDHSDPFEKIDSRTIHFEVTVPANGKKDVTYTVKYSW